MTGRSGQSLKTKVILSSVLKLFKNKNLATPYPLFQAQDLPFQYPVLELGAGERQGGNSV